jgi:hypothetical protein
MEESQNNQSKKNRNMQKGRIPFAYTEGEDKKRNGETKNTKED